MKSLSRNFRVEITKSWVEKVFKQQRKIFYDKNIDCQQILWACGEKWQITWRKTSNVQEIEKLFKKPRDCERLTINLKFSVSIKLCFRINFQAREMRCLIDWRWLVFSLLKTSLNPMPAFEVVFSISASMPAR